jgi:ParB family transcriptional regulator, chromosome partitioning protein
VRHFQNAEAASDPTPAQQKARDWLPEAMLFPAVDPAAPSVSDVDEVGDDDDTE